MRRRCGCCCKLSRRVDAAEGDVGFGEHPRQRLHIVRGEHRGDAAVGLGAAFHALGVGGELRIGGERLVAQNLLRQHAPFAVALDRDQDVGAVARLEHAVGRDRDMREPDALGRRAALFSHKKAQNTQKELEITPDTQKHFLCFLCLFVAKPFVA